ncbi:MAG: TorA maturation chaperone TorD [Pirellulaceae bacterium]|jgi:TorA maturation chaperone TorD
MFVAVGGKLPATDLAADDSIAETLEQLAIEYCVLFVGPKNHLPPFQSVWQTGQFQSQAISSMHDFMDVVNFTTTEDSATSMPDHLAVQLSVMAHLCTLMKTDQRPELIEIAQQFFARHLTWQVDLVDEVIQRDNSEFYGSVAEMTREFLSQEQSIWLVAD